MPEFEILPCVTLLSALSKVGLVTLTLKFSPYPEALHVTSLDELAAVGRATLFHLLL
jgi:hypothetical protein